MAIPEGITEEYLSRFAAKRGKDYDGTHSVTQLGRDFVLWFNKKTGMSIQVEDQMAMDIGGKISPFLDNPGYTVAKPVSKIRTTYKGHKHNF